MDADEPQDARAGTPLPLSLAEAERIIARLEEVVSERRVVLIGGQAVATWTAHLQNRLTDGLVAAHVVSGDIDFLGNADDVAQGDRCARLAFDRGIEVFNAVLDDERLPEKFRTVRLPQMQDRIRALRAHLPDCSSS